MNNDRDQHTSPPVMCKNNCGFCGSPANENYCSKCYREHLKRKSLLINTNTSNSNTNTNTNTDTTDTVDTVDTVDKVVNGTDVEFETTVETVTPETNKLETNKLEENKEERDSCSVCGKMVGLLGFSCRCGNVFCSLHRQANVHNCQFDYKSYNRLQLQRKSVKVVADKLERI